MSQKLIQDAYVKQLKPIQDERGFLMEMIRKDDPFFKGVAQTYMTSVFEGVTKAWHYHKLQWDHFVCVRGCIKLALYDDREGSSTKGLVNEFFLGEHSPILVQIPPFVWHGFKGVGPGESIVVNHPTETFNYAEPDEFRRPAHDPDIPYDWERKDR